MTTSHANAERGNRPRKLTPKLAVPCSVKLIGLGGIGGIVARYAAIYLVSLDQEIRFVLIDGDAFEPANAGRMSFAAYGNKATVVRQELLAHYRRSRVTFAAIEEFVTSENMDRLIQNGDILILAVDNHATRGLVSRFCAEQRDTFCLISGGNDGVGPDSTGRDLRGTFGNCQVHVRRGGVDLTPPLTHLHPEIDQPADNLPTEESCTEVVASSPQILFANLMAASCVLNALWLYSCDSLHYGEVCFDIADALMRPLPMPTPMPDR